MVGGGARPDMRRLLSAAACIPASDRPLHWLSPPCMMRAVAGRVYVQTNQPTNGTINSVLNAIEITLPMYG